MAVATQGPGVEVLLDLEERRRSLEEYYQALASRWAKDEPYYQGTFTISLPDGVVKIIPGTGREAIEVSATHVVTDKPHVQRRREIHTPHQQEDDDHVEAFLQAFLEESAEDAISSPLKEGAKHQFLRGEAILIGPFLNREKLEAKQADWLWFDAVDPVGVLLEPGADPREVFIRQELTIAEIMQQKGTDIRFEAFDRSGRPNTEVVTIWEYYGFADADAETCEYACWEQKTNEFLVPLRDSGYPYLPIQRAYSGYGIRQSSVSDNPLSQPELLSVSILNSQVKMLLEGEAQALSLLVQAGAASVADRWAAPDQETADRTYITHDPASVMVIPDGVHRIETEHLGNQTQVAYTALQVALDDALFPGVVQGQRPKGVDTVGGLAILSGTARLKFGPPLRQLEKATARLLENVGKLLAYLSENKATQGLGFSIRGRSIRGQQFHMDYSVKVELFADDPEERTQRISTGHTMQGKISSRRIKEDYYGIEDAYEDDVQMMVEAVMRSQAMMASIQVLVGLTPVPEKAGEGMGPGQEMGGAGSLRDLHALAAVQRSGRVGASTTQPMPGSVEEASQQVGGMLGQPGSR